MTVAYGHGIAITPLHLATAYATLVNGGLACAEHRARARGRPRRGERVISERTSRQMRAMLRQTVVRGTAKFADVEGYEVGGKTGTADKPTPTGGYARDKVISTFAGAFPARTRLRLRRRARRADGQRVNGQRSAPPAGPPCRSPAK
jgi:cell division protein FtsI (penicillin-binding protein 3)